MGANISCNQYYCQSISYKPEWFSPTYYSISSHPHTQFSLQRGHFHLLPSSLTQLHISKKLSFDPSIIQEFEIPLHFQINYQFPLSLYVLFSQNPLSLEDCNSLNFSNTFFIHLLFQDNSFQLSYSHFDKIFKGKIHPNKSYLLSLLIQNITSSSISLSHSFESSSKNLSSFQFHPSLSFPFQDLHLTFFLHSSHPFLSTHSFSFYLD